MAIDTFGNANYIVKGPKMVISPETEDRAILYIASHAPKEDVLPILDMLDLTLPARTLLAERRKAPAAAV